MSVVLDVQVRTAPKAGNTDAQNEDAAAIGPKVQRFAIADGASEGWQSGPWAKVLATAFVRTPPDPQSFPGWLRATRDLAPRTESTSWYAEQKAALGSFSTLLGISFDTSIAGQIKWRALAVGDSCLFQYRGGKLIAQFPIESASDFTNRPQLISSTEMHELPEPEWFAGRAELRDVFYLLTDALAEWFVLSSNANERPGKQLDQVTNVSQSKTSYADWIKSLRGTKALRNDDCTAVRIELLPFQDSL